MSRINFLYKRLFVGMILLVAIVPIVYVMFAKIDVRRTANTDGVDLSVALASTESPRENVLADDFSEVRALVDAEVYNFENSYVQIGGKKLKLMGSNLAEDLTGTFETALVLEFEDVGEKFVGVIPLDLENGKTGSEFSWYRKVEGELVEVFDVEFAESEDDEGFAVLEATIQNPTDSLYKGLQFRARIHFSVIGYGASEVTIQNNVAHIGGVLGTKTFRQIEDIVLHENEVDTISFGMSRGSLNDDVNVWMGRLIKRSGLNTKVYKDSEISSGAVDLFTAGKKRIVQEGARIGVHSWCCHDGLTADKLPQDSEGHADQIAYFTEMLGPTDGPSFYFYTLHASPFDATHAMTTDEMMQYKVATQILQ